MTSFFFQKLAVGIYRLPFVSALSRTRIGSSIYVACYDFYKRFLEAAGSHALARHIPPGSWAIDVGANIGFFTERFARWVRSGGRVIAVEPDGENLALLRRRISAAGLNGVEVHQAVALENSGSVRLTRNPRQPSDAGVTIDDLVEQAGNPPIGLIKIDTQGSEHRVLAGATKTLRRCRPNLFVEIDDKALRGNDASAASLVRDIQGYGYRFFKIERDGCESPMQADAVVSAVLAAKPGYLDVLCVPHSDAGSHTGAAARSGE